MSNEENDYAAWFEISKGRTYDDMPVATRVTIHITSPGILSREVMEEKLEDLIGQVLDVY